MKGFNMHYKLIVFLIFSLVLTGCEQFALLSTPPKKPMQSQSQLSKISQNQFWDILHKGQYDKIHETTSHLTAAYLENPNDPSLAAHIGFLHIWKITERARHKTIEDDPLIVNEIILAKKYFKDAVQLDPKDARFQGFLGDSILITGKIFHDEREQVRGYFQLKRAIAMWPAFNYFTAGYPMSILNPHSKSFQEGLGWQWKTLELCSGTTINRDNPDFSPYMSRETQEGALRACWNSWIAPHNFEGFFLNMGDMLVKSGDWQRGIKIYKNARLSKTYSQWPYRQLLENRIVHAKENVSNFQKEKILPREKRILFNSGYGCVACHQAR